MSEEKIQTTVFEDFKKKYQFVETEVPALLRSIDLVFVNESAEFVSIEFKISDWRKAVKQAAEHRLVVDKSYICLPKKRKGVSEKLLSHLEETGIGLLIFELCAGEVKLDEVVKPEKTKCFWEPSRIKLESFLYGRPV